MTEITTVGAWGTKSALDDPAATVAGLVAAGVNFFSQMLNNYGVGNTPAPFRMHDPEKVLALASACQDAGIEFSFTSWIMPDRAFIEGAAAQLIPLLEAIGPNTLLVWDAEEVWVRGHGDMSHDDAAALVGELFAGVALGVTGIVHADKGALMGLTEVCGTWMPQCYATERNVPPVAPATIVERGFSLWRSKFGRPTRWIIGLAAYYQPSTPADYMQPCIDDVRAEPGVDSVCYWWHRSISARQDVTEFVAGIRSSTPAVTGSGIFVPVDVAAMSQMHPLVRHDGVALIQGELVAWAENMVDPSLHPGPVDGLPGQGTLAAVRSFQVTFEIPPTGVVDVRTWSALSEV